MGCKPGTSVIGLATLLLGPHNNLRGWETKEFLLSSSTRVATISARCPDRSKTSSRSSFGKKRMSMAAQSTNNTCEKSRFLVCYLSTLEKSELGFREHEYQGRFEHDLWCLLYVDTLSLPWIYYILLFSRLFRVADTGHRRKYNKVLSDVLWNSHWPLQCRGSFRH